MSVQALFFHPNVKSYYNQISYQQTKIIFIITLIISVFIAGLRGYLLESIFRIRINWINNYNYYEVDFILNPIFFLTSAILVIIFIGSLTLFHWMIYTNNEIKTNLQLPDIILLFQIYLFKDLFLLIFSYIKIGEITSTINNYYPYYHISEILTLDMFLQITLAIFLMFFLIPKILPRLDVKSDYNKALIFALFISIAIIIFALITNVVFKSIIELPFNNY